MVADIVVTISLDNEILEERKFFKVEEGFELSLPMLQKLWINNIGYENILFYIQDFTSFQSFLHLKEFTIKTKQAFSMKFNNNGLKFSVKLLQTE